jgi:hypothetical protein
MIPRFSQIQSDNQSDTPRKPVPTNLTNLRDPVVFLVLRLRRRLWGAINN